VSDELEEFLQQSGVKHLTLGPHYPSFNGLAELSGAVVISIRRSQKTFRKKK